MVKLPVCQPPIGWSSYICASLPLAGQATRGLASHFVDHACNLLASLPLASHACYLCASLSEAGSKGGGASLLATRGGLDGEGVGRGSCNGPPAHLAPARGGGQEHHLAGRSRTNTRRIYLIENDGSGWRAEGGHLLLANIKESLSSLASGLKLYVQVY
jgi:hypothetical protein